MTNEVLQTYGDAPMVKLTNIEADIESVKELSQQTTKVMDTIVINIQDIIEERISNVKDEIKTSIKTRISDMKDDIKEIKKVVNKALADDCEYDTIYSRINDISFVIGL